MPSRAEHRRPAHSPAALRQEGRSCGAVAREGSAELRQEGEDSRAFTPAPTSLILYIVKNKSREAQHVLNITSTSEASPHKGRRQASNPPKAQDGFLRPRSQQSVELSLTLKLSWFPLTCIHAHTSSEACVHTFTHIHAHTWAHCTQSQGLGPNTTQKE